MLMLASVRLHSAAKGLLAVGLSRSAQHCRMSCVWMLDRQRSHRRGQAAVVILPSALVRR